MARFHHVFHGYSNKTLRYPCINITTPISFKTAEKKRWSLPKIVFFLDIEIIPCHTFLYCELQYLPRGNPRDLCANTRIRLLATHLLAKSEFADNGSLLSSRGSINWCRNYGAKRRLRAKLLSSVWRIKCLGGENERKVLGFQCGRVNIFLWERGIN